MAHTKSELEALKNSLLASGKPDKIKASDHRQFEQALINEMFDPQSRANVMALVQKALSVSTADEILVYSNGQARLVSKSLLTQGVPSNRVYLGRIATANIPATGSLGEYFQNSDTGTYWQWEPTDAEFPDGTGTFVDTGDLIQNIEIDQYPTTASPNAVSSGGVKEELDNKANSDHTHFYEEIIGLADELDGKLWTVNFKDELLLNLEAGSGINITQVGNKIRINNTFVGGGEGANDFIEIGGLPLENFNLAAEFAKYSKKPVWKASTLVGTTRTFDLSGNDIYEFSANPSSDEIWVISNIPASYTTQVVRIPIHITYETSDFTATLPANSTVNKQPKTEYSPKNIGVGVGDFILATVYPDGKIDWTWDKEDVEGGGGGVYDLASPTTITVGGIPAGSNITGLTSNQLWQWLTTGIGPVVGTGFFDQFFDNFFN